jgi:hypothetical protein
MPMSKINVWPYAIGISIALVFSFCVATIVVTAKAPVQESDIYMAKYQDADSRANEIIQARILFDKLYNIEYLSDVNVDSTVVKYKITDKNMKPVNDAAIKVILTRADLNKDDIELTAPKVENGIYTFNTVKLPKAGRWNVMAKINIADNERFYNLKADTRKKEVSEY